ncbi:MAG: flavodoxin family protein [Candidatus Cloacimonetes bacterium]|nr:flavodoxin family protein [Candidatus Cloacimonadota bacterium]
MKALGINGSPRINGNTARLIGKVLEGCSSASAETEMFHLNSMDIAGCQACMYCRTNDGCATKDDMGKLYAAIKEADVIVLGSPIYIFQMSGQTKIFMDRLFALYGKGDKTYEGKKLVLAFTQGAESEDIFSDYIKHTEAALNYIGFDVRNVLIAPNTGAPDDIEKATDIMDKALQTGKEIIEKGFKK